jgi:hypothetical protein
MTKEEELVWIPNGALYSKKGTKKAKGTVTVNS